MADIKQAAKWMQEGKHVRRTRRGLRHWIICWNAETKQIIPDGPVPFVSPAQIQLEDLLADDWELAE